jgi:hypothetical protein
MGITAQFNPSTALMHFTDATKRVQVVDDSFDPGDIEFCDNCDKLMGNIRVTLSGVVTCCSEILEALGGGSHDLVGPWASYLNFREILVGPTEFFGNCLWTTNIIVPSETLFYKRYAEINCTGEITVDLEVESLDYNIQATPTVAAYNMFLNFVGGSSFSFVRLIAPWVDNPVECFDDFVFIPFNDCNDTSNSLHDPVDSSSHTIIIETTP